MRQVRAAHGQPDALVHPAGPPSAEGDPRGVSTQHIAQAGYKGPRDCSIKFADILLYVFLYSFFARCATIVM
jgi:hypothetical protein